MTNLPKTIKIHELPEISEINDTDIFIIEDGSKTYKINGKSLIENIKNNTDISSYFVHQTSVNNKNGIAPLDENKKVPIENLLVGTTSGTLFDGGRGKALEDSWDAHLLDNNDPHGSNAYTDQKIADLINGAPTTLDTLKEIADAMTENEEVVEALESAIGNKANQSDLTNHVDDYTVHVTEEEKTTWNNMASGGTGISSLSDLGVTATADELNYMDGVTSNVQIQLNGKAGTDVASTSANGLMSSTDKTKLNYYPYAHYSSKSGSASGYYKININSTNTWMLSFVIRVYQGYRATDIMVSGYNYSSYWYNPSATILGDSSKSSINVEFGYDSLYNLWVAIPANTYTGLDIFNVVNGYTQIGSFENLFAITHMETLTGTVQTTITAYSPWYRNETVSTATALSTSAGSATQPVYFSGGKPVATTHTLGTSVPRGAKFTDTVYTHPTTHAASMITAGTFGATGVVAATGTDYTTNRIRNTVFTTEDPGAGATVSYANGSIICVYE